MLKAETLEEKSLTSKDAQSDEISHVNMRTGQLDIQKVWSLDKSLWVKKSKVKVVQR